MTKHLVVSTFAKLGISVGMPSRQDALRDLLARLHPVAGGSPMIRLGDPADGGYVLPDDLEGIRACFSPGVDDRATFERDIARRGIPCFLADASVASAPVEDPLFRFLPKFLGVVNDDSTTTLHDWVEDNAPGTDDLLLQMDIEGHEVPVILNVTDAVLRRFRIIVIELHNLDRLLDREGFTVLSAMFSRLLEHFVVVHNHPNNYGGSVRRGDIEIPRVLETTFLRRDRVTDWTKVSRFPHPLDVTNAADRPDVILPAAWHG